LERREIAFFRWGEHARFALSLFRLCFTQMKTAACVGVPGAHREGAGPPRVGVSVDPSFPLTPLKLSVDAV
jgi:hypothetical protein